VLRDIQQHAHTEQADEQRRTAIADERQRDALRRQQSEYHAHVHERLDRDHRREPEGNERPEPVFRAHRDLQAAPRDHAEANQNRRRTDQAELLADHRVDEVGVRFRQIEQLLNPFHQSAAGHAAGAHGNPRLDDLEAVAERVLPGIEKREQTAPPVRRGHQHGEQHGPHDQRRADDIPIAQAGGKDHHADDQQQRHRGAVVALEEDQSDQDRGHDDNRCKRIRDIVDAMHAAIEDQAGKEDRGNLGELGRLDAETTDAEPAPGPVDGRREQHSDEQHANQRQHGPDEEVVPVGAVVDPHGDRQHRDSHRRPQRLPHQKVVRLLGLVERQYRGRAVDHDDADADEQDRGDEQNLVRLELSRHLRLLGDPSGRAVKPRPRRTEKPSARRTSEVRPTRCAIG
jgi:hypothetical protein